MAASTRGRMLSSNTSWWILVWFQHISFIRGSTTCAMAGDGSVIAARRIFRIMGKVCSSAQNSRFCTALGAQDNWRWSSSDVRERNALNATTCNFVLFFPPSSYERSKRALPALEDGHRNVVLAFVKKLLLIELFAYSCSGFLVSIVRTAKRFEGDARKDDVL